MAKLSERGLHDALSRMSAGGVIGDEQLRRLYNSVDGPDKGNVVVALGDTPGDLGLSLLQDIVRDRTASEDRRCAAVIAVAKRMGAESSALLQDCLSDGEPVREYAMYGLAAVGDDRAWSEVQKLLIAAIAEQTPNPPFALQWQTLSLQSTLLPMICYLGRHLAVAGRRESVTRLVRENWSNLYTAEQRWFDEYWPGCDPGHSDPDPGHPDPTALSEWAGTPIMARLHPAD